MYKEQDLIEGIKQRDGQIMHFVYVEYFPMIQDLVQKNGGTREDASDVFQEGMVVLYEKVQDRSMEWSSTIKTYLFAVCRNKWLMELRKKRIRNTASVLKETTGTLDETYIHKDIITSERNELMRKHFKQLGDDCRRILTLFFESTSMRDIGKKMGFSEAYAKKKKFTCQKQLIEAVMSDPVFNELK